MCPPVWLSRKGLVLKERPLHMQSVFLCNPRWALNPDANRQGISDRHLSTYSDPLPDPNHQHDPEPGP